MVKQSLKNIRQIYNISLKELAQKSGFSKSYICLIECGKRKNLHVQNKLERVLTQIINDKMRRWIARR
jgi:transcriptional regulator with XRE-family HTH domain